MRRMGWNAILLAVAVLPVQAPGAEASRALLDRSFTALGGEPRVQAMKRLKVEGLDHTLMLEQSERPEGPYGILYETFKEWRDLSGHRLRRESHTVGSSLEEGMNVALVVTAKGGSMTVGGQAGPARPAQMEEAEQTLALSPERILLTAKASRDLREEREESYLGKPQRVLAFTWKGFRVRLLVHPDTFLPTAVEILRPFRDFWFYWGDVKARTTWGDWRWDGGVLYPRAWQESRNGQLWRSGVLTSVKAEPALDEAAFKIPPELEEASTRLSSTPSEQLGPWTGRGVEELEPGILFFPGPWNVTLVKVDDGIVLLEAPIKGAYVRGALEEARRRFPGQTLLAAISTSDSWPHHGGVRECVAEGLPVFILDSNRPLLSAILSAPWSLRPDTLQQEPRVADLREVSGRTALGKGRNRMELIPLRGNGTERQMLVYFPEHQLLYVSDTLASQPDGSLFNPGLDVEVANAVRREHLAVRKVFAMHSGLVPWNQVLSQLGLAPVGE